MALPEGLTRLSLATLPRERWRNGKGWTRLVAQADAGTPPPWRVSLAEITEAAPFSVFDGIDRTTVLVQGGPVSLLAAEQQWTLSGPGDTAQYPGELALRNTAPADDTLFWNVMTQRGRATARTRLVRDKLVLPERGHSLIWVLRGTFDLAGEALPVGIRIEAAEGLHWQGGTTRLAIQPAEADSLLLHTLLTE